MSTFLLFHRKNPDFIESEPIESIDVAIELLADNIPDEFTAIDDTELGMYDCGTVEDCIKEYNDDADADREHKEFETHIVRS